MILRILVGYGHQGEDDRLMTVTVYSCSCCGGPGPLLGTIINSESVYFCSTCWKEASKETQDLILTETKPTE